MKKIAASKTLLADLVAGSRILADHGVLDAYGHVSARSDRRPDRFIMSRSLAPALVTAAAFGFIGGAAEMAHTASNMATMQLAAPQEMRGRVASLMMLYPAMISAGAFLAGPLSDALGVRGASVLLAAVSITALAALYVFSPHLREMRTQ